MILSFSGDAFLVERAARRALQARGFRPEDVTELAESLDAEQLSLHGAQAGLFNQLTLLLDFDLAFKGQAGVKPRNEVIRALADLPDDAIVVILDRDASPARQKTYKGLGEHQHLPTPRFAALSHWVRQELKDAGLRFQQTVPETLADIFGEDLPGIAAEIQKLAVLEEELTDTRLRQIVNRPASRDAFQLIEATVAGDKVTAVHVCRSLLAQGEAGQRVLGALTWQYNLVAWCVALGEGRARLDASSVAQALKVKPFVAQKALTIAMKLSESDLHKMLRLLQDADIAMKTGKDESWTLLSLALDMTDAYASL
ncbi:MAG: DNA polymerase III subunit delta [Chloroflexi bacterium AL-N5]|nr:DNA polymerase III subunit delta [Chloroflexi bacterium AL-N5]